MKPYFIFFLFMLLGTVVFSQESPSQKVITPTLDSLSTLANLSTAPDTFPKATGLLPILFPKLWDGKKRFTGPFPIPKKALFMAFTIPGGGQIYNKKFWKLPVVYGLYGLIGYSLYYNTKEYKLYKEGYIARLNGLPDNFDDITDANVLLNFRNKHRKNVQLSAIGIVVVHALIGIDAFVDAHLYHFNVDEDLSMGIGPSLQYTPQQQIAPGIRLSLSIRQQRPAPSLYIY